MADRNDQRQVTEGHQHAAAGASRRRQRTAVVIALIVLPFACMTAQWERVPPQTWQESRGPVVPHDMFPADCTLCHLGEDWYRIRDDFQFDHAKETGVALRGAHAYAECLRCHNDRGPVASYAARGCRGCHEDFHHGQLGTDCGYCHTEQNWLPSEPIVKHNRTRFPLIGAHAGVACFRCHPGAEFGNFSHAPTACESCHGADLALAVNPNHASLGWTQDCQRCHIPTSWRGAGFNHSIFPLIGQHASAQCASCHQNGVFRGTPRNCVDCHLAEYNGTTAPNHAGAGFSTDCQSCHTPFSWGSGGFNHQIYPLTGAHAAAQCSACHQGGVFRGTPRTCVGCHQAQYNATTNPNHLTSGFSTNCQVCHNTTAWQGAVFNHPVPLKGPHNVSCTTCHPTPGNSKIFTCIVCHEHRQTAMDDKHKNKAGYAYNSQACLNCHPALKK